MTDNHEAVTIIDPPITESAKQRATDPHGVGYRSKVTGRSLLLPRRQFDAGGRFRPWLCPTA